MGVVRKYRVKYAYYDSVGGYQTKFREFSSLREAGEFVRDFAPSEEFREIRVVEYGLLTEQERAVFLLLTKRAP